MPVAHCLHVRDDTGSYACVHCLHFRDDIGFYACCSLSTCNKHLIVLHEKLLAVLL